VGGHDAFSGDFDLVAADVYFDPAGPVESVALLDDYIFSVDDLVCDEKCGERSGGTPGCGILGDPRYRIEESRDQWIEPEEITPLAAGRPDQGSEGVASGLARSIAARSRRCTSRCGAPVETTCFDSGPR
jgi:hypothetical protein